MLIAQEAEEECASQEQHLLCSVSETVGDLPLQFVQNLQLEKIPNYPATPAKFQIQLFCSHLQMLQEKTLHV
jgi:hypothetical protein